MLLGLGQRNRLAQRIARADEQPQLQLEIHARARPVERRGGARRAALAHGPVELLPADAHAGRAAMVGNRQPLEVVGQGIVRPRQPADVARVVNGGVEVGVVGNPAGQAHFRGRLRQQAGLQRRRRQAVGAQQVEQRVAQRAPGRAAQRKEVVQHAAAAGARRVQGQALQRGGLTQRRQVQDLVANRHAAAKGFAAAGAAEYAERQVLDREIGAGLVGRGQPAARLAVVGAVQFHVPSVLTPSPSARRQISPRRGSSQPRRRESCAGSS